MATAVAYCWASGEIEVALESKDFKLPKGTIIFARGSNDTLCDRLSTRARHSHINGLLLVPGLPEREDEVHPVEVLQNWCNWAFDDWPIVKSIHTEPEAA